LDYFDETFEDATDYDLTWTEYESSGALNPNASHPSPLSGGGSECLGITMSGDFGKVYIENVPDNDLTAWYYRIYFYIDAHTLAAGENFYLFSFSDNSYVNTVRIENDGGDLKLIFNWYKGAPTWANIDSASSGALSLDTWYRVELHWSEQDEWELRLDGATIDSGGSNNNYGSIDTDGYARNGVTDTLNCQVTLFVDGLKLQAEASGWCGPLAAGGLSIPIAMNLYRQLRQ